MLACCTSFLLYLHRYTFNFVGPKLKEEYGLSDTYVGTLGSMFNWTYGPLQIPSGICADLFGPHLFLGISIATWSIALALQGVGGLQLLGAARLLFGASQAGTYPCLTRVTHSWFPARNRTIVQGWIATFCGRSGGFVSSIVLGTVLMGWCRLSWQQSLLCMSSLGLLFAVIFIWSFRSEPEFDERTNTAERLLIRDGAPAVAPSESRFLPWGTLVSNRSMWFFVTQQLFSAGADNIYSLFMGGYFLTIKKVDLADAGFLVGLPLLGGAIGGMLGGYCNDWAIQYSGNRRWSRTAIGATGNILACVLMFVAISRSSAWGGGCALFAVKFFSDWSQPTVWGTCTDLGERFSASVFSIINTAGTIAGIAFPPLFGWILDTFPSVDSSGQAVPGYLPLFALVAGMYFAAAGCWLGIDSSKPIRSANTGRG